MCIQRPRGLHLAALALVTALGALTPADAHAQVPALTEGSVIVGGSLGIAVDDDGSSDRATSISVAPRAQVFVRDGLALGGDVLLGHVSQGSYSSTAVGVGPAVAFYFGDEGTTHPFLRGGVRWRHLSSDSGGQSASGTTTSLHAEGGLLFLLSDAVGVEGMLFWEHSRDEVEDRADSRDRYGLQFGVSAFVF